MRTMIARQRLVRTAAVATSVLLAAACAAPKSTGDKGTGSLGDTGIAYQSGMVLLSDGTNVVTIGSKQVTFPTTVTDAVWSPDGSRIAFIDGDGNVATARLDGSGKIALTSAKPGAVRSRPTWNSAMVVYAEKRPDGTSVIMTAQSNGCPASDSPDKNEVPFDTGDGTGYVDLAPSANDRVGIRYKFAFQHDEPSGPQIWVHDSSQRGFFTGKLADGKEPALSPDGQTVAYVGANGQIQLKSYYDNAKPAVQITFGVSGPKRLAWNGDGSRIAFETGSDVESVATSVPAGATTNPTTQIAPKPAVPTYLRAQAETIARIKPADVGASAIEASQARWPTVKQYFESQGNYNARGALITSSGYAAKALGATGLYAIGPVLYTSPTVLDPATKTELQRIFGTIPSGSGPHVDIVGDTSVVSTGVETALKAMGYTTTRVSTVGAAPGVSTNLSGDCGGQPGKQSLATQTLVVTDPSSASDLLVAQRLAASLSGVLLPIDAKSGLNDAVKAWLGRSSASITHVFVVDAAGAISADVDKQLGDLLAGPLGFTQPVNPTVEPIN
jgi:hypothetical protein